MTTDNNISENGSGSDEKPSRWAWHRRVGRLASPIIISNLSVPLLGIVDTAVMGHLPDPAYLGAVAIGSLIFGYISWGFGFLRMGTTGLTAQATGRIAREGKGGESGFELRAIPMRAGALAVVIALLVMVLQVPIIAIGLGVLDASAQVEEWAALYLQIRIIGLPATLMNYVLLGWFLGQEDAKTPLFLQIWTNGVNIILDIIFVVGLGYGVEGVAIATVIAEVSGALIGLYLLRRRLRHLDLPKLDLPLFAWAKIRELVALNGNIMLRTLCLMTAFAYFTAKGATMGDTTLAANAVLMNFMQFAAFGLDGFAHAAEAIVGRYAGQRDRANFAAACRAVFEWSGVIAIGVSVIYLLSGEVIIDLLTGLEEVREIAYIHLPWAAIMPAVSVSAFMFDGIFIGATRSKALRNAMILSLIGYIAADALLRGAFGNHGLWAAMMFFMVLRGATLAVAFPKLLDAVGPKQPPARSH